MLREEKVLLRPIKKSDKDFFLKWMNDPEVTQYIRIYLPINEMLEEKWIENISLRDVEKTVLFVIEAEDKVIGNCSLNNINKKDQVAVFGIIIGEKDCWGKGYGVSATKLIIDYGFNQLNLRRISSSAISFNERSIALHKKTGFKEEGRLRKNIFVNGSFYDEVLFGLLREEWKR